MPATRRQLVDGREVRVYDGLLSRPDLLALTKLFDEGAFTRTEWARPDTAAVLHWVMNIPHEASMRLPTYEPTLLALGEFAGRPFRSYRSYCNHSAYGDMLFTHTDSQPGSATEYTALWYIAPEWDVEWGGETLLFNKERDAEVAVSPKPGRLLIFDGSILHAGRPPNRNCYAPRYTLAYKLEPAS